jgi:acyl dehydratase
MSDLLYFDNVDVGQVWESPARTVTETDVVNFACMTGDFTALHVDHHHAADTPFRKPIAHGLLGLSLLAGLSSRCPNMSTAAFVGVRDWKFLKPIFFGDTLHVVTEVIEKRQHGRKRGEVIWHRQLVNHEGQVVQSGVFETLVNMAMPQRATREEPAAAEQREVIPHPARGVA